MAFILSSTTESHREAKLDWKSPQKRKSGMDQQLKARIMGSTNSSKCSTHRSASKPLSPPSPAAVLDFPDELSPAKKTDRIEPTMSSTKSVRFAPLARVNHTISRHDMSPKEHLDYWLQDWEFRLIQRRNKERRASIEIEEGLEALDDDLFRQSEHDDGYRHSKQETKQKSIDTEAGLDLCLLNNFWSSIL